MPHSPATALAAPGVEIVLADGTRRRLLYTLDAMRLLEQKFGTVVGVAAIVKGAAEVADAHGRVAVGKGSEADVVRVGTYKGPGLIEALELALAAGLMDERVVDPRTGDDAFVGDRPDLVGRLLHPGRLREYVEAFGAALNQAFDTGEPAEEGEPANPTTRPRTSPGRNGSTSSSGKQGARSKSSGK